MICKICQKFSFFSCGWFLFGTSVMEKMEAFDTQLAQPYWESSQRLLHPKCVWLESFGGYRHFIFDRSMFQDQTKIESSPHGEMKTGSTTATSTEKAGRHQIIIGYERSKSLDLNQNDFLTIIGSADSKLSPRKEIRSGALHSKRERILEPEQWLNDTSSEIEFSSMHSSNTDIRQLSNEIDLCKDLLADRVLQWLDLAENNRMVCIKGKESYDKPMAKRRSVTAKESTKSTETQPALRRESIHHLSMTFDEGTANVIQTDDIIPMSHGGIALRFDQFFPTTYRCSRKFLSLRRSTVPAKPFDFNNSSNRSFNVLMHEADDPHERRTAAMAGRKQKQSGKFGVDKSKRFTGFFDDQYHSMIQRQILETSCNTQLAKRQLHIFMPNLPKRCSHDGQTNSRSANDCASCISSQVSSK